MNNLLDSMLGENNWSAHCISLVRCEKRRERFNKWAEEIDMKYSFWDAVDKNTLKEDEVFTIVNNGRNLFLSPGATACSLSHIKLCRHLIENYNQEYFFIFEDDAGFSKSNKEELYDFISAVRDDGAKLSYKWQMLTFGYHDTGFQRRHRVTNNIDRVITSYLAHAYLINRKLVQYMIDIYESQKTLAFDWILDLARQQSVCLGPSHTIIDQVDETSYIGYEIGKDMKLIN